MLTAINGRSVDITVTFETKWTISLDPGAWVTEHRGDTVSVTTIYGRFLDGQLYIGYPKGVTRKAGGAWSLQERILVDVLPGDVLKDWQAIPEALRSALEDAYLLSRDDLPDQLEAS